MGLFCVNTVKFYTSWNTAIRILFGLPRQTNRYFMQQIDLKTMLCSRFVSFCESMCKSPWLRSDYCLMYAKITLIILILLKIVEKLVMNKVDKRGVPNSYTRTDPKRRMIPKSTIY